jgi:hypothetical protein
MDGRVTGNPGAGTYVAGRPQKVGPREHGRSPGLALKPA